MHHAMETVVSNYNIFPFLKFYLLFQNCLINFDNVLFFSYTSIPSCLSLNIINMLIRWSASDNANISILSHFDSVIFYFVYFCFCWLSLIVTYFLTCLEIFDCDLFGYFCEFI